MSKKPATRRRQKVSADTREAWRSVAALLERIRVRQGIDKGRIAKDLGIHQTNAGRIVGYAANPRFSTLDRHARVLGVSGGIVELIRTNGDASVLELLRAWDALPDPRSQAQVLDMVWAAARGHSPHPVGLTPRQAQALDAFDRMHPQMQEAWLALGAGAPPAGAGSGHAPLVAPHAPPRQRRR